MTDTTTTTDRLAAFVESTREPRARAFAEGRGYSMLMQEAREWIECHLGEAEGVVEGYSDDAIRWGMNQYYPGGWEYFAAELG